MHRSLQKVKHHCDLSKPISKTGLSVLPPNATFGQWMRQRLLRLVVVTERNPRCRLFLRSSAAIQLEKLRHIESGYIYILHPFSWLRTVWEIFMYLVMLLSLVIIPYGVIFHKDMWVQGWDCEQRILRLLFQIIYLVDIVVTFLTGYHHPATKEIVLEPARISVNYMRGQFWTDILSSIPLDLMMGTVISATDEHRRPGLQLFCELMVLLKAFRIITMLDYTRRMLEMMGVGDISVRLTQLALLGFMFVHWMACFHFLVPVVVGMFSRKVPDNSWVVKFNILEMTPAEQYINCLFRSVSSTACVAYGHEDPLNIADAMMSVANVVLGAIYVAHSLVVVLSMRMLQRAPAIKYQEIMNELHEYMSYKQLPLELQEKLIMYHEFRFQKSYFQEDAILNTISDSLRKEISLHSCNRLLANVDIFRHIQKSSAMAIVNALKLEIYLPQDIIVKAGSSGDKMWFINLGTVALYTKSGLEMCHLQDGFYFGEVALLSEDGKHYLTVEAVDICELFRLDKTDFRRLIMPRPEMLSHIDTVSHQRRELADQMERDHQQRFPQTIGNNRFTSENDVSRRETIG